MKNTRYDWWSSTEGAAQKVLDHVTALEQRWAPTHKKWLRNLRYFTDDEVDTLEADRALYRDAGGDTPLRKNLVRSQVETLTNKIVEGASQAIFKPKGADPSIRYGCERLSDFVDALFDHGGVYGTASTAAVIDALLCGSGVMRPRAVDAADSDWTDIEFDVVPPHHILYDNRECTKGQPPGTMYEMHLVPRETLLEFYSTHRDKILAAQAESAAVKNEACQPTSSVMPDRLRVAECWHLPVRRGGKGVHAAYVLDGGRSFELFRRDYTGQRYPHAFLPFFPLARGWYLDACCLADVLAGYQSELDITTEKIQSNFQHSPSFISIPKDSGIADEELSDDLGFPILRPTTHAQAPQIIHGNPIDPRYLEYERTLVNDAYSFSGTSQMAASSQRPQGIEAAVAMQFLEDSFTSRFTVFHKARSQFFVELAKSTIQLSEEAADRGRNVEGWSDRKDSLESIRFKDIRLPSNQYVIRPQTVSRLPKQLAQQVDLALKLVGQGQFPRETIFEIVTGITDFDREAEVYGAAKRACDLDIEACLKGEPRLPDSRDALDYCVNRARQVYLLHRRSEGASTEGLAALEAYLDTAESLLAQLAPPVDPNNPPQSPQG